MKNLNRNHNSFSRIEAALAKDSRLPLFLFAVIIVIGVVLRIYDITRIPPGLWYDEAINGLDALDVLKNGPRIFFMTEGHPREHGARGRLDAHSPGALPRDVLLRVDELRVHPERPP